MRASRYRVVLFLLVVMAVVISATGSQGAEAAGVRPVDSTPPADPASLKISWSELPYEGTPEARAHHTAVWTGKEVIIWGGDIGYTMAEYSFNTGARYDPVTDSWRAVSRRNAPSARSNHSAVWTGQEMIIVGGSDPRDNTFALSEITIGGRYNPETDTWTPLPSLGAPMQVVNPVAVWTGQEVIVWGRQLCTECRIAVGARYNPVTNTWAPMSAVNQPPASIKGSPHVWTGKELIIWGTSTNDKGEGNGAIYNPVTDTWAPISSTGSPDPGDSNFAPAVWTGSQMIVMSGSPASIYTPETDTWAPTAQYDVHLGNMDCAALWIQDGGTGKMFIWGGYPNHGENYDPGLKNGALYDPVTDTWAAIPTPEVLTARSVFSPVWTGSEVIIWGGGEHDGRSNTGARYNPATQTWTAMNSTNTPTAREDHTAVWTGNEMIVWGGQGKNVLNTGDRYNPKTRTWAAVSTTGSPSARVAHQAVWTGTEMLIWGGNNGAGYDRIYTDDGARYNPVTDQWTPMSTVNAPSRVTNSAWTGHEMIVWGFDGGGRYDPVSDTWKRLPTTGAPKNSDSVTLIWTGSEVIFWGSYVPDPNTDELINTGARYVPRTNTWRPISRLNAPSPRELHTAVWSGKEMIIWGGEYEEVATHATINNGARYNPVTDTWTPVKFGPSLTGHSAVWASSKNGGPDEMIICGGILSFGMGSPEYNKDCYRYDPLFNRWLVLPQGPLGTRESHSAVWTRFGMLVWGGHPSYRTTSYTGALLTFAGRKFDPFYLPWLQK